MAHQILVLILRGPNKSPSLPLNGNRQKPNPYTIEWAALVTKWDIKVVGHCDRPYYTRMLLGHGAQCGYVGQFSLHGLFYNNNVMVGSLTF